jgi:hypothetical protein
MRPERRFIYNSTLGKNPTWAIDLGHLVALTSNAMSACTLCVPGARPRSHLTRGTLTKLTDEVTEHTCEHSTPHTPNGELELDTSCCKLCCFHWPVCVRHCSVSYVFGVCDEAGGAT